MNTKLPPALQAAQRAAAEARGDPLPVDLLPKQFIADALDEIELRTGVDKFKAQDTQTKAREEASRQQPVYDEQDRLIILRLAKQFGYIHGPKPKPIYPQRGIITIYGTQRLTGLEHWNYFQDVFGAQTEYGTAKQFQHQNMNELEFWWDGILDRDKWLDWAVSVCEQARDRYVFINVEASIKLLI